MPDALGAIGSFFSSGAGQGLEKLAGLGATTAGIAGNLSADKAQASELNYLKQQQAANATLTPQQLGTQVAQATQPLNAGLVQGVENQVSGSLAEQGLSEAPSIQASVLAQALAPYQQQNQNTALQLIMQKLGLPIQYGQAILGNQPQQSNVSPLIAMLLRQQQGNQQGNPYGGGLPANFYDTIYGGGYNGSNPNLVDTPISFSDPFSSGGGDNS